MDSATSAFSDGGRGPSAKPLLPPPDSSLLPSISVVLGHSCQTEEKEKGNGNGNGNGRGEEGQCCIIAPSSLETPAVAVPPEIEYIDSEDLVAFDDSEAHSRLSTLLDRLDSKDWLTVTEALNHVRQLCIFHTSLLLQLLDNTVSLVTKAMKNPRSTVCKTSIMASSDLFKAYQDRMLCVLDPLLLQLLLKASQDKRFVCEEAERALEGMVAWLSPMPLMQALRPYLNHRNPRIRAKAATCACRSAGKLGNDGMNAYGFDLLLRIAATQLNDKLPEAREAARNLIVYVYAAYREQASSVNDNDNDNDNANASDTSNGNLTTDSTEATWKQFCCSQLSSSIAQAVLRLTSPTT